MVKFLHREYTGPKGCLEECRFDVTGVETHCCIWKRHDASSWIDSDRVGLDSDDTDTGCLTSRMSQKQTRSQHFSTKDFSLHDITINDWSKMRVPSLHPRNPFLVSRSQFRTVQVYSPRALEMILFTVPSSTVHPHTKGNEKE